jgi:hypothetical protein
MTEQQPGTEDATFDITLRLIRERLVSLTCAIGAGVYFDAWLASVQLLAALDRAESLARTMVDEAGHRASRQIRDLRSIAAPMLALAPAPGIHDVRRLRGSNAYSDRWAWEQFERQWQRHVLQAHFCDVMSLI